MFKLHVSAIYYNALIDCLFVRIIICPFVIMFILYWVEKTRCSVKVQIVDCSTAHVSDLKA